MRRLETRELLNALRNLVTDRKPALAMVTHGDQFLARFTSLVDALAKLPESLAALPLAELLATIDDDHDAWGKAIDFIARAIEEGPEVLSSLRPAVELVRERYMTKLAETRAPYAVEDERARKRLATLEGDKPVIDRVTAPDGRPLSAWINEYATSGTKLGGGLADRADVVAATTTAPDARSVQALRAEAQRAVGRLRQQIQLDLENNTELPDSLMGDVLGYVDELSRLAEQRARPQKPTTPKTPA